MIELNQIQELLKKFNMDQIVDSNKIDGLLIKKMAESNILKENRDRENTGKQTHIALTSKERALFPIVATLCYSEDELDKKFYDIKLKLKLSERNIKKLEESCGKTLFDSSEFRDGYVETYTKCYTRKDNSGFQIQLSKINSDDEKFIKFRKLIYENDYIVFIKLKDKLDFICLGLKKEDSTKIIELYGKDENILYLGDSPLSVTSIDNSDILENTKINLPYQKIVYGAPGTGKSYILADESEKNFKNLEIEEKIISHEEIERGYWSVGAIWNGDEDKLQEFIENKCWINGYDSKYIEKVKNVKINDFIAIKSCFTRKENGKTISVTRVKALGVVTENYDDGKKLGVDWKITGLEKDYDNVTLMFTIQEVKKKDRRIFEPLEKIISPNRDSKIMRKISACERVTFYDGYTYGQFVGAYKPVPVENHGEIEAEDITYKYVPGPLFRHLIKAYNNPNNDFVLIIEEINRARADRVFGNIFQLLDRADSGESEYPVALSEEQDNFFKVSLDDNRYTETIGAKSGLYLPSNLYIWATMNSADQGVYPMDSAFKRRWNFKYIGLDENADNFGKETEKYYISLYKERVNENGVSLYKEVEWNKFRKVINSILLNERIPEDRLLAPFFIKPKDFSIKDEYTESIHWLDDEIYESKILMYLFDDVLRHRGKDKIFNKELRSFSELISAYKNGKNIFNENTTEKMLEEIVEISESISEKQD